MSSGYYFTSTPSSSNRVYRAGYPSSLSPGMAQLIDTRNAQSQQSCSINNPYSNYPLHPSQCPSNASYSCSSYTASPKRSDSVARGSAI